jgi:hypothetical protein
VFVPFSFFSIIHTVVQARFVIHGLERNVIMRVGKTLNIVDKVEFISEPPLLSD